MSLEDINSQNKHNYLPASRTLHLQLKIMFLKRFSKCICFTLNLTIATRIIGFIGLVISLSLITVLLSDKFSSNEKYELSETFAHALGLDWQHLHPRYSFDHYLDPGGKLLTILVIFYSTTFLVTNSLLILGSIKGSWRLAIPWLICEFLGCLSKLISVIYRYIHDREHLGALLIRGSVIYIVVVGWWWIAVLLAVLSWRKGCSLELTESIQLESVTSLTVPILNGNKNVGNFNQLDTGTPLDSPIPYSPNVLYERIQ